jgi:hypothetical protein
MTMQYDVKGSHLSGSGFMYIGRTRLKNLVYQGNGTAGSIDLFDTAIAPVTTATYARSGTTITVTSTSHGMSSGQEVGITFGVASGSSATAGNYVITVTNANTFTITDINSGTIAGGTACNYVSNINANPNASVNRWLTSYNTGTAVQPFQVLFQGEGMLATNGIYVVTSNITYQTVQYG